MNPPPFFRQPNKSVIKTHQEQDLIMSITGGLPLELERFFSAQVDGEQTLGKRLLAYIELFREEYQNFKLREYFRIISRAISKLLTRA